MCRVPPTRKELYYDCCKEPYPDVTFTVTMRRRTLYYGLNLILPCMLISGLALLVFLLPADSEETISHGTHTHTHTPVQTRTITRTHTHTNTRIKHTHTHTHTHTHAHTHTQIHV